MGRARIRFESDGSLSHGDIARSLGVSRPAVSARARDEGWQKARAVMDATSRSVSVEVTGGGERPAQGSARVPIVSAASRAHALSDLANGIVGDPQRPAPVVVPTNVDEAAARAALAIGATEYRRDLDKRHKIELDWITGIQHDLLRKRGGVELEEIRKNKLLTEAVILRQDQERKLAGIVERNNSVNPESRRQRSLLA